MLNEIQQFMHENRLKKQVTWVYQRKIAIKFLQLLKKNKKILIGWEGFHILSDGSIQVDMGYNGDFYRYDFETAYQKALDFLEKEHPEDDMAYEVIYMDNGDDVWAVIEYEAQPNKCIVCHMDLGMNITEAVEKMRSCPHCSFPHGWLYQPNDPIDIQGRLYGYWKHVLITNNKTHLMRPKW